MRRRIRAAWNYLWGEWPVPRWICLCFVIGAIAEAIAR